MKKKRNKLKKHKPIEGEIVRQKDNNVSSSSKMTIHSGPLPPAEAFEHYDKILPGAANRILTMSEINQITDKK